MISTVAINEFLNMKFPDNSLVKNLSTKELVDKLDDVNFITRPFKHQLACTYLGLEQKQFLFFLAMGTGKTKIILDILGNIKTKEPQTTLVLSPNISSVATWSEEIQKHSTLSSLELVGETEERWYNLRNNKADLVLLNYTGLLYMLTEKVPSRKNEDKNQMAISSTKIKELLGYIDNVVYDEIHLCKNYRSLTYQICKYISNGTNYRFGLTGTPFNRDPIVLCAQFYLIDLGETLGKNMSLFREAFFNCKPGWFGGMDYKFKKELLPVLNTRITNRSIRYSEYEVLDLPEKTEIKTIIVPTKEMIDYYNKIDTHGLGFEEIKSVFIKFRQLCSGFINFKDSDDETATIELKDNPKVDTLVELINSTPEDDKIIVFLEFIKSGDIICNRLKKEKIGYERLYGGTKDKVDTKNRFINKKDCKVLVANIKSGGVSLNLQVANYVVFFELPLSSIDREQALKRSHRTGQKKNVFIYSMVTKDTIEEKIEKYLKEGKNLLQALIDGKEKLK